MGTHIIKMPDIGEGIAEVELVEWHVQPGDSVVEDQLLADVMTDKATVQVPSPVHGKVVSLGGAVGEVMAVGSELIRLEVEGAGNAAAAPATARSAPASAPGVASGAEASTASAPAAARDQAADRPSSVEPAAASAAGVAPDAAAQPVPAPQPRRAEPSQSGDYHSAIAAGAARPAGGKPLASPAVRQRAWDLGIELQYVPGTGPAGRISHGDLDAYLARGATAAVGRARPAAYAPRDDEQQVPVIGLRRKIAQKMQESKRRIPHFTYVEEIDVTELEALRSRLNAQWGAERGKLTILPFLARAMVLALREFPQINARYDDDNGVVTRYGPVHMGIAAQTDAGLMVPVLRHAETLDLWSCASEITRLADAARSASAARDELSGSTITLTSLGSLGGIVSTPVINHPEVAIVGVNRIVERPVILGGAVVARKIMNLSSSFDHRVVDGMHAAQFIQRIRGYLECPAMLFVE
ncbi:dihydrolipoamide acetyltransferase family protein [Pollutimonas bauzanensis]|uniref:Dihydrolipoamide acetyltransferase component of pyruvate dehydrogenase complex n=1 Tax=Pollutimonas bauzanensis TaxID=658167 RepID=A0A1M5YEV0_9BURK|nr:dihydrolipoamide acetyltransferase family protein [Pollutimonas bauzanensis]SHI10482.1 2-oxoisovalerate dehydrogenase E2 component (dihydrolipoyl transacylase) [Pollutimonas bauzanensis]